MTLPADVHNERTKLPANALDRASTACGTVGVLTPVSSILYGWGRNLDAGFLVSAFYVWFSPRSAYIF
jgi:hypothetical protein